MTVRQTTAPYPDGMVPAKGGGFPAAERARLAAFASASRHSRRVRFLKLALPASAAAIVLGFLGYSYISMPGSISFDIGETGFSDGKLVMANPKVEGYTQDRRPFTMTAARALQDPGVADIVELEGIDARLPVNDKTWANVGSKGGIYDRKKNTLDIPNEVTVTTTDGMTAVFQSAKVNMATGALATPDPVDIKLEGMHLTAQSMNVLKNGEILVFTKQVRMKIEPGRLKMAENESGDGNVQN